MAAQQPPQGKFDTTIARVMVHALNTFYCRGATLGTTVNLDTMGCMWTGKFDLDTLKGNFGIHKRKSCRFKNIRIRVDGALNNASQKADLLCIPKKLLFQITELCTSWHKTCPVNLITTEYSAKHRKHSS